MQNTQEGLYYLAQDQFPLLEAYLSKQTIKRKLEIDKIIILFYEIFI